VRVAAVELINQLTQYNCMGLDMWLEKKTYVQNWDWMEAEDRYQVTVLRGGKPTVIRPERVSEEVACWRKANAIHRWFVENVQHGEKNCAHSPRSSP
jgi:hypothetical protein